jgi:hypothetical protein
LNFIFDNNLPPSFAHAIRELSKREEDVTTVLHLRDRYPANTPDVIWLRDLGESGRWFVVSIDRFKKGNDAEREVIRRAGHSLFVLDSQWARQPFWGVAERLVHWWPRILDQSRLATGAFRVPWRSSSKGRFDQIRI